MKINYIRIFENKKLSELDTIYRHIYISLNNDFINISNINDLSFLNIFKYQYKDITIKEIKELLGKIEYTMINDTIFYLVIDDNTFNNLISYTFKDC